jgi:hypothetical protein
MAPTGDPENDPAEADDEEEEIAVEREPRGGRRGRPTTRPKRSAVRKDPDSPPRTQGQELWREGVRTGLGPGKEVFIQKPAARDPGETPFRPGTIHPNTLLFLQDLAANNERQWLKGTPALLTAVDALLTDSGQRTT